MKHFKIFLAIVAMSFAAQSCLEYGLEDIDTYEGDAITAAYAYYRYIDKSTTIPASGEYAVKQKQLSASSQIDASSATCNMTVSIPSNFTDEERNGVNLGALVVATQISTAAVIEPVDGSPRLGVPADWTSPHKYKVTAAGGGTKIWTISVTLNK